MLNMKLVAFWVVINSLIFCSTALPQPHKFGLGTLAVAQPVAVPIVSVPRYYPVVQTVNVVEPIVPLAPVYPIFGRFG